MIADPEPDEQIQGARDDAHCLGLRQGADRLDDLAQVHAGPGGYRDVHHDRVAERCPVDVDSVSPDNAAALQPGQPVGDRRSRHLDGAGERALRLACVMGERAEQRQVEVVDLRLLRSGRGNLGQPGERS